MGKEEGREREDRAEKRVGENSGNVLTERKLKPSKHVSTSLPYFTLYRCAPINHRQRHMQTEGEKERKIMCFGEEEGERWEMNYSIVERRVGEIWCESIFINYAGRS